MGLDIGTVAAIRRYPVKSLLGEELSAAEVSHAGVDGDRRYAVVHQASGRIASAKHPRLWRSLLTCAAAYDGAAVRITLPGGGQVSGTEPEVHQVLSNLTGRPVRLTSELPPDALLDRAVPDEVLRRGVDAAVEVTVGAVGGPTSSSFVDFAAVHLLSTSTLERISALSPRGTVEPERYRPNIVIHTPTASGFPENDWYGRDILIGEQVVMRVVARTPRCAVPTLAHGDLLRDTAALRMPATYNRVPPVSDSEPQPCAGVYAEVHRPGRVTIGDPVRLAGQVR